MSGPDVDAAVRAAAFEFLRRRLALFANCLPRGVLSEGFVFQGVRVPLVGPQGIFKPRLCRLPLSITTVAVVPGRPRPYEDLDRYDGLITYRYRGTDPSHHENAGLRRAMVERVPLVYLRGVERGFYAAFFPSFVVGEDRGELAFTVDASAAVGVESSPGAAEADPIAKRYALQLVAQRLHQAAFRARVITAYRVACAMCTLHDHPELLDAAHILADRREAAPAAVDNGLSLCKFHHAAFDANIVGVRPDYKIEVRDDVLDEIDGPMLVHGLQRLEGRVLSVPRKVELRPRPEYLEERFEAFQAAG
ncbi:MAG: HNH endonuclease [Candidatus Dormibacterales bacterium]